MEEAQDNLPSDAENAVEDIDVDPTIEPAGGSDPAKPSVDLDIEDEGEADDDEAEAQTEAP